MDIIRELRNNSKWDHWREGFVWLLWSLVGGLFPVWLTMIGLKLTKQEIKLQSFTGNGEFALYSASYVAGTLYILFKDFQDLKKRNFPSRSVLGLAFSALLLVAAAMFMVVCLLNVIGATGKPDLLNLLDKDALRRMSLVVFPVTMVLSLLVMVTENVRMMPDLNEMAKDQLQKLGSDFDKLAGGSK